jgi:plasmid stability protein
MHYASTGACIAAWAGHDHADCRNVNPLLKERLRVRAAHNGRSMESELRHILDAVLTDETPTEINLAEAIRRRFAPLGGVELEPHPRQPLGEPPSFE